VTVVAKNNKIATEVVLPVAINMVDAKDCLTGLRVFLVPPASGASMSSFLEEEIFGT
jgi:hypothetical protein